MDDRKSELDLVAVSEVELVQVPDPVQETQDLVPVPAQPGQGRVLIQKQSPESLQEPVEALEQGRLVRPDLAREYQSPEARAAATERS